MKNLCKDENTLEVSFFAEHYIKSILFFYANYRPSLVETTRLSGMLSTYATDRFCYQLKL